MKVKVYVFMMFLMMQFLVFSMQQDYLIQAAQNLEESFDRYEKISNKKKDVKNKFVLKIFGICFLGFVLIQHGHQQNDL